MRAKNCERSRERSPPPNLYPLNSHPPPNSYRSIQPKRSNAADHCRFLELQKDGNDAQRQLSRYVGNPHHKEKNHRAQKTLRRIAETNCDFGTRCKRADCLFKHPDRTATSVYQLQNLTGTLRKWKHAPGDKSYGFIETSVGDMYCSQSALGKFAPDPLKIPCTVIVGSVSRPTTTGGIPIAENVRIGGE